MRFFLYLYIIISLIACNNPSSGSFRLEGSVENAGNSENMILYYHSLKNGEWYKIIDTTKIINGKFVFEGRINELTAADLCFDDPNIMVDVRIYLEPSKIMRIQINKNQPYAYQLSGTSVEADNMELRKELEPYKKILCKNIELVNDIMNQIKMHDDNPSVRDSLINSLNLFISKMKTNNLNIDKIYFDFISTHSTCRIIPDLLYLLAKSELPPIDTIKSIYNNLPEQSRTSLMGKLTFKQIEYLEGIKDTSIGSMAPDFTRQDFFGKTIRLSDFKDCFVLLDFWASWCVPCIEEIPKVKELHNKYSAKGLKIIGISSDNDKNHWFNAINKHQLNVWTQILSVEDRNNAVFIDDISSMYNVEAIPYFILIDKQGKIVVNELGEEALIKTDSVLTACFMP